MCTSPVSCSIVHAYALPVDSAVERDAAFPSEFNTWKAVSELQDKAGCDGEVRFSRMYGCYCFTQSVPPSLLGGGFSELTILKSTPFVTLLLITLRIFQWWRFSRCDPGGLALPFRTRVWEFVVHVQQAWCSLTRRMLWDGRDEQLRIEVEKQRCRYAGKLAANLSNVLLVAMICTVVFLNVTYPITSFVTIEEEMRAGGLE
jgi:hypothetical protein